MAEAMSKSAKKRANAKARAAAAAPEPAAPVPPAAPAKPEAKQQPKAKAKADAKPKDSKPAQKAPPAKAVEEAPKKKVSDLVPSMQMDDGTGGEWSTSTGISKKNQKRKENKEEIQRLTKEEAARQMVIERQNQHVPGMATKSAAQMSASKASQSVGAAPAQDAAKPGETEAKKPAAAKTETVSLTCPEEKIGRVIGPKGSNMKLIQEKSGCGRIDTEGGVFTVSGPAEAVAIAEAALRELIEKGYTSLAFDNFSDASVMVHPSCFPDLIGTQGAVIRKIKESLKVEVSIPPVPKNAPPGKKYPVTIAGAKADADKAKEVIESIVYYYHHEITHEGLEHVELEIDPWSYSYIIGTKGSELKHIQKNYDVRLYIPREHSANHNVVVVGSKKDCDRTKAYIDKLILKASEPRGGGGRGADAKADDHWGKDDGAEEPWMQQYMYKRK